jgi:polyphosphate kinase 2 (PPK2 family)
MFESAELGHRLDDETYDQQVPLLREALLDAQFEMNRLKKFPVVVVVGGLDGSGKGQTGNTLLSWLDAHHVQTHALEAPTEEEAQRPFFWRFWRDLPPRGKTGVFLGSWYTDAIAQRAEGALSRAEFEAHLDRVERFERLLSDSGVVLFKVWLHLTKQAQHRALAKLDDDPNTTHRVTRIQWRNHKQYDALSRAAEVAIRETSTGTAPWRVIEGLDPNYRHLTCGQELLAAVTARLAREAAAAPPEQAAAKSTEKAAPAPATEAGKGARPAPAARPGQAARTQAEVEEEPSAGAGGRPGAVDILSALDLKKALKKERYEAKLPALQGKLDKLVRHARFQKRSLVAVFEGSDAAGKGGAIRRFTEALDARLYRVIPIAAPTEEERAQPYLWRFWRQLPRQGHVAVFDRSWYGRVLVERVEGFCSVPDWQRAYGEINELEAQLVLGGVIVSKFWLQIDPDEQLRRFKEREQVNFKRYKITEEDYRNRAKAPAYHLAAVDMVDRTSTDIAPWTLVEANDKYHARLKVLRTLADQLEAALD